MWALATEVVALTDAPALRSVLLDFKAYGEVKASALLEARRLVKKEVITKALRGWAKNHCDKFGLADEIATKEQ